MTAFGAVEAPVRRAAPRRAELRRARRARRVIGNTGEALIALGLLVCSTPSTGWPGPTSRPGWPRTCCATAWPRRGGTRRAGLAAPGQDGDRRRRRWERRWRSSTSPASVRTSRGWSPRACGPRIWPRGPVTILGPPCRARSATSPSPVTGPPTASRSAVSTCCAAATQAWWRRATRTTPYVVDGSEIVDPADVGVILPVPNRRGARPARPLISLTTCHPRWSSKLIVSGHLAAGRPKTTGPPPALTAGGAGGGR